MSSISHDRRKRPSLFGPIVLIAIGLFFLFTRLNPVTELYWGDLLRLWPLFLVFIGMNILVQQAPRPFGLILSGLVALLAVVVFGYVLIAGLPSGLFGKGSLGDWQTQEVSFALDGVESAVMDIEIGPPGADMFALEDSGDLIAGSVTYLDGLLFDKQGSSDRVTVSLAPRNGGFFWDPGRWQDLQEEARWELGLNPNVPMSLDLTAAAGTSKLDLRQLMLTELSLNVSAGEMTLFLPDGDYDLEVDTNAAATTITLPEAGIHTADLRVNAGAVTIELPEGMELRVEVDQALSSFNNHVNGLKRIEGRNIWQTAGYEDSTDRIDLNLHISVGSVDIR